MDKYISVVLVLLLIGTGFSTAASSLTSTKSTTASPPRHHNPPTTLASNSNRDVWTPEEEGSHYPCPTEWWYLYSVIHVENYGRIDISSTFQYWMESKETKLVPKKADLHFVMFNRDTKECFNYSSYGDNFNVFSHKKNGVDLKYNNCTLQGLYPDYTLHLESKKNKSIILDMDYHAQSRPYWLLEDITNGYIPFGLGSFRYGVILRGTLSGKISFDGGNTFLNVTGVGYYEHAWGNLSYANPFKGKNIRDILNALSTYGSLFKWFVKERLESNFSFPTSISFNTMNIFGYDWCWGAFENGWTVDFWKEDLTGISKGPATGFIVLEVNGTKILEFSKLRFKYTEREFLPAANISIPTAIEVDASKQNKRLHLLFEMTTEQAREIYQGNLSFEGLCASFAAGRVEGYYHTGEKNITLQGYTTYATVRYFTTVENNEMNVRFFSSPEEGLGALGQYYLIVG